MDVNSLIETFLAQQEWLALLVLAGAALIEYLFPPFPGDTVTLAGAILVTGYDWSLWKVFTATTAGSLAGAMADFYLGVWWLRRRERKGEPHGRVRGAARVQVDRLVRGFERHGAGYLVINRFLPGVRAFFFVAAGLARMQPGPVAFYAGLSAALWNALLIAVGMAIGANLEQLERLFSTYSTVVWGLLGAVVLFLAVRWFVRRRRQKRARTTEAAAERPDGTGSAG